MSDGLHRMLLPDRTYGPIYLAAAIPHDEDAWGVLAPLRGTVWGSLIREVPADAVADAKHGYSAPLMKVLGPPPYAVSRRLSVFDGLCRMADITVCASAAPTCRPGPKVPACYDPPHLTGAAREAAMLVVHAWRDEHHVVVVIGEEFNLR